MYMEVKTEYYERTTYLTREGGDIELTVMDTAANQNKLVFVRKGTVVKVFQA